jgi:glycerol-3-phosphate acyltransferase PlsY
LSAHIVAGDALIPLAYLVGCFSTGYYAAKIKTGQDIRDLGSGNAGAQNAGVVLGKPWFFIILFADMLKGIMAVLAARWLHVDDITETLVIVAVVSGHIWPVQMQFRGGMGISTSLGALLAFDVRVFAGIVVVFFLTFGLQSLGKKLTHRQMAARSAVAAINLVALTMVCLNQPLMHWLALIILGVVHYAGYRHRLATGWPRSTHKRPAPQT